MEATILVKASGLLGDTGKENGNYYIVCRGYTVYYLGLYEGYFSVI